MPLMVPSALVIAATSMQESRSNSGEIVVIGKRLLEDPPPISTISSEEVSTFSAESVGDAIEAAKRRVPGGEAPVIVNGRRVGSIADISSLPPETIERIEILPPAAGARRGLGSRTPVVNVVLKRHFRSLSINGQAQTTTDGGGGNGRLDLGGVMIEGERRSNANINGSLRAGLRFRQRFDDATLGAAPGSPDPAASLQAASKQLTLTGGKSLQLGAKQLTLHTSANLVDSPRVLTGQNGTQRTKSTNINGAATLSGMSGRHFWTIFANGAITRSTLRTRGGATSSTNRSDLVTVSLTGTVAGPLLKLGTRALRYDTSSFVTQSSQVQKLDGQGVPAGTQRSLNSQAGIELPLFQRGDGPGLPGDLSARLQARLSHTTGSDTLIGYERGIHWGPSSVFSFDWNDSHEPAGGVGQLDPVIIDQDVLLFDPVTQQSVRVRQISGGNPGLLVSKQRRSSLRASAAKRLMEVDWVLSAAYSRDQSDDPILIPSPSLVLERAFPDRFVRDGAGRLLQIDARPLNAYRSSSDSLGVSFNASGTFGTVRADTAPAIRNGRTRWTLNLQYNGQLHETLQLTTQGPVLDLRAAGIDSNRGGASRTSLSMQAGVGNPRFGTQLRAAWRSNTVLLGQGGAADGLYKQPLQVSADAHLNVGQRRDPGRLAGKYRLHLSIDNLLNRRPRISFPDRATPFALLPASLDPIGRTVRLSLQASLN